MKKLKKLVFDVVKTIPKGKVTSYSEIGKVVRIHPRIVAKILASNKDTDSIPCFRVVRKDGNLSGYVLGVEEKIKRLKVEGVKISGNKIKNFKKIFINASDISKILNKEKT